MESSIVGENGKSWPRVAVVGAGAVGGYFGGMLARAGAPVVMVGRKSFVDAVQKKGLLLDTLHGTETVRVEASVEMDAIRRAEVVLFCVKSTDTAQTVRELAPFLAPGAMVVSLQNGVDNVARIRAAAGIEACAAVVYLAASVPEPGLIKHVGRGDLVIGPTCEKIQALADCFVRAGVPCRVTDNIEGDLWAKFISNCALNGISALGRATYGRILEQAEGWTLVETVIDEVMAVAHASRITISNVPDAAHATAAVMKLAHQIAGAYSSTAQDLNRGKLTEIGHLNGFVVSRGRELGIPTPANLALFALIKLAETNGSVKQAV